MIRKIEVERFTLNSSKPFDQVVAALNSAVGHPDMAEFWKSTHQADGVHLSYDRMTSFLAAYNNSEALRVARHLG